MSATEPSADHTGPTARPLTATDVRTYATLAWLGIPLVALVEYPLMWLPAAGLFLLLRERDQAGLLRRHLAQAVSFSAVMTIYALVLRYILETADVHGRLMAMYPVFVALAVAYPCVRGVRSAQRLQPYTAPEPLAWMPLDRD